MGRIEKRESQVAKKAQKRIKHVPLRTCIGCRTVLSKRELIRIVHTPQGVLVDPTGKATGRGAYLHNIRSCWEQALKGPINHALRIILSEEDRNKIREFVSRLPEDDADHSTTLASQDS